MGRYDFDRVIERKGTGCLKWDSGLKRKGRDDLLPLWVADMDFPLPEEVLSEIHRRVDHGIFGYQDPTPEYLEVVSKWMERHHGWSIRPEEITVTPGVVFAIALAVRAYTDPGDAVLITNPVYYPFSEVVRDNHRSLVSSDLVNEDGFYTIDFADFEQKIAENHVKLFLLCSPHNPVGRVWTRDELLKIGQICERHHVTVFADEIHEDIVYPGHRHIPFASVDSSFASFTVTGTSPSKTFNLAGLQVSNIIIQDQELRKAFRKADAAAGYSQANVLGMTAAQAVYEYGEEWYRELLTCLEGNIDFLDDFLKSRLPGVKMARPEGTYLTWLDFSGVCGEPAALEQIITDKAHLWLDPGAIFGENSALFERVNVACPRSTLERAAEQLAGAFGR